MPSDAHKEYSKLTHRSSEVMRKVQSSNTSIELLFRKALWRKGYRYSLHKKTLPGKPDIVLAKRRMVIFVDGDFWHGGQWSKRNLLKLEDQFTNTSSKRYWISKIKRNMQRDAIVTDDLLKNEWNVLRLWESDIKKDVEGCVNMTVETKAMGGDMWRSILPRKTVAEFFSGIGLMRKGLETQGWHVCFANDIDEQKCSIYKDNFHDLNDHLVQGDIHKLAPEQVPLVTLATASFPCNDLSLAGSRKGLAGKQSSAFWGFANILEKMGACRPPLVLLENVTGFLTSHGGDDFKNVLLTLNRLGYSVDAFILDAARFVPQSRQRLFVVGSRRNPMTTDTVREQLQFYQSDVRPSALADFIFQHEEINWNIRPLPSQPQRFLTLRDILEDIHASSTIWWDKKRSLYLLNQMSPRHREIADRMISGEDYSYGTIFRRVRSGKSMAELRTDGIAGCLRTPRGGSGRQILFKAGKGKYSVRLLTPRECARLMGVDDFIINVSLNQALFGFGDAVCVPVIEWIAEYYLNPFVNEMLRGTILYPIEEGDVYGNERKRA